MEKMPKVLMVEDSQSLAAIYASYLRTQSVDLVIVEDLASARAEWSRIQPDLVLLDVELPDGSGLDLLKQRPAEDTPADVIVMTAFGSSDSAVDAISLGAIDYLSKPFDADRLKVTIANAFRNRTLQDTVNEYSALDRTRYCDFIGKSLAMQSVYRIIDSVAVSKATAFIVGESGTGKELTASAIHQMSPRADKAFHAINCGAIPRDLMESELFGHVKGAFTGATSQRDGAASIANGGTLFLDEICEMDIELQKKMLRFIQTGEFQRVGSNSVEKADIRFVCATNKDPLSEVREGRVR
ncbi:MAG: sigma-54 dependent transcriptional regulator, partial [Gammaproteobacteria bacterium]